MEFAPAGDEEGPKEELVALLTAVPFAVAAISTIGNAWHSKRSGECSFTAALVSANLSAGLDSGIVRSNAIKTTRLQQCLCISPRGSCT